MLFQLYWRRRMVHGQLIETPISRFGTMREYFRKLEVQSLPTRQYYVIYMSTLFPDSLSGPNLPPFRTFLVKGSYHPSAPIHLCLSHTCTRPRSKTLLLTPSRSNFMRSLAEFNDDWLSMHSGHGKLVELSSRIEVV
jgi:hypothetical protein